MKNKEIIRKNKYVPYLDSIKETDFVRNVIFNRIRKQTKTKMKITLTKLQQK